MSPAEIQFTFIAIYFILLFCSLERGMSLKRPFLYSFVTNISVVTTQLISIYAFAVYHHIAGTDGQQLKCGYPGPIILAYPALLFIFMFFKRTRAGQYIFVAAVAMSIFAVNNLYDSVDYETTIFGNDSESFTRSICSGLIPKMISDLEETKARQPETSEVMTKVFQPMIFDGSSEIYMLMNKTVGYSNSFKSSYNILVPTKYSRLTNIYRIKSAVHHYYTTGGRLKDIVIYCDNIPSEEIKSALEKAREQVKKSKSN